MRHLWFTVGLGALVASPGCLEVALNAPQNQCTDFSLRSLQASPTRTISLVRESRAEVSARFNDRGELRAVSGDFLASGASFEEAALELLQSEKSALRVRPEVSFQNPKKRIGKAATYIQSEATYRGVKIYQGQAIVALKQEGTSYRARRLSLRVPSLDLPAYHEAYSSLAAVEIAQQQVQPEMLSDASTVELVALPTQEGGVWAYRVMVFSEVPRGEFEVLLNAQTKEVISIKDTRRFADGTGLVFDPNPIASTGNNSLTDANDQSSQALNDARFQVTLLELDGTGILRGPFVDAKNASSRATDATLTFNFDRTDNRFEEVMAYFHLDRAQRYIQSLGFTDVNNRRQLAIVNAFADDNSFYSPSNLTISYGSGGVDDAEDADIVVHEYGHSIQDNQGMGGGGDEGAMGEGFGDYLAATVNEIFSQEVQGTACVGDWDTKPCLRRVDGPDHFPEEADGEVHDDGEIWSALLFELRGELGAETLDTILLESQFLLGATATFAEGAQALIDADQDLFLGQHAETIRLKTVHRGYFRTLTEPVTQGNIIDSEDRSIAPCDATGCTNKLDDTQIITVPGAQALSIHFSAFATEEDPNCFGGVCDNVYLYDGAGNLFDILGGAKGAFDSKVIPGDTIQVRLITDFSVESTGYTIDRVDVIEICQ